MFEPLALPPINRLLRANAWALDRLRPHAGKTVHFICPPGDLRVTIAPAGDLVPARADAFADVTIRATPGLMLRFAARDDTAWAEAQVTGDVELAAAIDYVRRHIAWDFEEDLSRLFGDVAAHRLAGVAREADRWARNTFWNLAGAFAEFATYEAPLLASPAAVEAFNREVDELRDAAARLEKRIELLERRLTDC